MKVVSKTGLFVLLLLLAGGGCTQTEVEEDDIPPYALKEVDAGFKLNVLASRTPVTRSIMFSESGTVESETLTGGAADTLQTRAATDLPDGQDSKIASLWVGQYDNDGNRLFSQYIESMTGTSVNIKLKHSRDDSESHVWFVANSGDLGEIATEAALKEHVLTYSAGETGLPSSNLCGMSGMWKGVVKEGGVKDITVDLTRLPAKITFTYAIGEGFTFTPSSVTLRSVPDRSQVTAPQTQLSEEVTYKTYSGTTSGSGATMYWYLPENMAGTVSGENAVGSEKKKTGKGVTNATYIELTGSAVQGGVTYGDVTFRFYPGSNENNYDIIRNSHYTVSVTLVGIDVSDERITVGTIPPITVPEGEMPAGKGGEKEVQITARPGEEWSFDMPRWLSALIDGQSVGEGATLSYRGPYMVTFQATQANPRAESRSVEFSVKVNGEDQSVIITQSGSGLEKGADISLGAAPGETGSSSFTATKGLEWDAASSGESWWGWADDSPAGSGSEATGEEQSLNVKTTAVNPQAQPRSGKITVKAGASVGDPDYIGLKQEITVTQAGSTVAGSTVELNPEAAVGQTSSFTATWGLEWAAITTGDWLTLSGTTSGSPTTGDTQNITFGARVNPTSSARVGEITVRAGDESGGPRGTIRVTQKAASLEASADNRDLAATADAVGTLTFKGTSGLDFSVTAPVWLTLTGTTSGQTNGGDQSVGYETNLNLTSTEKTGDVKVIAGEMEKTVAMKQAASVFTVDKTEIELESAETSGSVKVNGTVGLPWTVSPSSETNGITPSLTSSTATGSDQTLTFSATENKGIARSAKFTVAVTGGDQKTVTVEQKTAKKLLVIDQTLADAYKEWVKDGVSKDYSLTTHPPFSYDGGNYSKNTGTDRQGTSSSACTISIPYAIEVEDTQNQEKLLYHTGAIVNYCISKGEGWRVPTMIELFAMWQKCKGSNDNACDDEDASTKLGAKFCDEWYWSSTVYGIGAGTWISKRGGMYMKDGQFSYVIGNNPTPFFVRCVRDSQ